MARVVTAAKQPGKREGLHQCAQQAHEPHLEPVEGPELKLGGAAVREPGRGHHGVRPEGVLRLHRREPGRIAVLGEL